MTAEKWPLQDLSGYSQLREAVQLQFWKLHVSNRIRHRNLRYHEAIILERIYHIRKRHLSNVQNNIHYIVLENCGTELPPTHQLIHMAMYQSTLMHPSPHH